MNFFLTGTNKIRLFLLLIFFNLLVIITIFASEPKSPIVRTRWTDPNGKGPSTYKEWKNRLGKSVENFNSYKLMYQSPTIETVESDSFEFGEDYAYIFGFIYHYNDNLCRELPPQTGFVVYLNGSDSKILTDQSPRWCLGDPNISGKGWYGIELGNFNDPEIAVGDSFQIIFTYYGTQEYGTERGEWTSNIPDLPLLFIFPNKITLNPVDVPLPPIGLNVNKTDSLRILSWIQESGLSYTIYRRSQNDTLVTNLPRFQYDKIAEDIIDSVYVDSSCIEDNFYGYIIFAKDLNNGLLSGRSQEVHEEILYNKRVIYVQPDLYSDIQDKLLVLAADWEEEGAEVLIYSASFSTIQSLRYSLKSINYLDGALLIGDFPVPWFEYSELDEDSTYYHQEFPCDLYYMDLDGTWQDNYKMLSSGELVPGTNGIYDTHLQDYPRTTRAPEIVVGRITPTSRMGDPAEIINLYLDKCHNYRKDFEGIRQEFKALAFPDDDWHEWGNDIATNYMSQMYSEYVSIYDINQTSAVSYKDQLDENYSLIHLWAHSWSGGHSFKIENGNDKDWFYNYEIVPAHANANFYVLFACGNSRYTDDNYCGGVYALLTETGINSFGSTHSGGMLEFPYFYERLAEGVSFGKAFLQTYQYVGKNGFDDETCHWYYGLTFNGDPFIVPRSPEFTDIVENENRTLPQRFTLSNYPNPFNALTTIEYNIPQNNFVRITIYNLRGEKIKTLVNENKIAGKYLVIFDGSNFASGIYFYRIEAGNYSDAKKLVLMK